MSSDFLFRFSTLDSVIWTFAKQYEIKGVLTAKDLYQEGLIELDKTISLDQYRNLSNSKFSAYFKVRLTSKFKRLIAYHKRKKRDWRRVTSLDSKQYYNDDDFDGEYSVAQENLCASVTEDKTPETDLEYKQKVDEATEFVRALKEALDPDARKVLEFSLEGVVPDEVKARYERVPDHISITMIGIVFGWDREKAWGVVNRIRRCAVKEIKRLLRSDSLLWTEVNTRHIVNKKFGRRVSKGVK